MTDQKDRISFAYSNRAALPGEPSRLDRTGPSKHAFNDAHAHEKTKAQKRESFMVKRSQPKPILQPNRALSRGADRAAFNSSWSKEQQDAATHKTREERKAAFNRARSYSAHHPKRNRSR